MAYLGASVTLPVDIFSTEQARWLQVSVAGLDRPRVMLTAVPYAIQAADAQTLGGMPASSFIVTRGDGKLQTAAGADVSAPMADGSGVPFQIAMWGTPPP